MNSPHKLARTAVVDALAHATLGWNETYPAIAAAYEAPVWPFRLDFSKFSGNVFLGQLAGFEDLDFTQLDQYQCVAIYTTMSSNAKMERPRSFSGPVLAHVDWALSYREKRGTATGVEANDTESPADAIDEAMSELFLVRLGNTIALPSGIRYFRDLNCDRTPLVLNEDGFSQIIRYEIPFEVHL
jgi:hypothetical protein